MSFEARPGENEYTRNEFTSMRAEGDIAIMTRMRWQDRGPEELLRQRAIRDANPHLFVADVSELPATWRGQPLRVNSMKYAKRGGKKEKKKAAKRQRAMPNVGYTPLYKGNDDDENGDGDAGRLGGDWLESGSVDVAFC
jgi:hypothetical protein